MISYHFVTTAPEAVEYCSEYGCNDPAVCECAAEGRPLCRRHAYPLGGVLYGRMAHQMAELAAEVAQLRGEMARMSAVVMLRGGGHGQN